ncbi:MAG TPA: molybdopterin molybdotransferase MoeA [Firmicutes bacterium]|nr:molybdopterin molybdotransferase MoeA [Bacillota bacterium]
MRLLQVTDPQEVLRIIEDNFKPLPLENVPLIQAGGRILGEDISSREDVPGFNRSTVDGYAVASRDTFGAQGGLPAILSCLGEIVMGQTAPSTGPGKCYLIHTGGMLPPGSDAVVMVEDTESMGTIINCYRQVAPGENVIHRGEDLAAGEQVLAAGCRLRAPELGLLASIGITEVAVHRRPVIGILSSGDELVPYQTDNLLPGQIRDCNAVALSYLGQQAGATVKSGGIMPDSFPRFLEQCRSFLEEIDFLVLSGGSSVGTRDYTARTLQELGPPGLLVEGVAVQPGKPTLLASCCRKPVLGLPGHPVSALIIFYLFGRAVIRRLCGQGKPLYSPSVIATLTRNVTSRIGRAEYIRVKLRLNNGLVEASPVFGRSGMLRTLSEAHGIIAIAPEKEGLLEGDMVEVTLWE